MPSTASEKPKNDFSAIEYQSTIKGIHIAQHILIRMFQRLEIDSVLNRLSQHHHDARDRVKEWQCDDYDHFLSCFARFFDDINANTVPQTIQIPNQQAATSGTQTPARSVGKNGNNTTPVTSPTPARPDGAYTKSLKECGYYNPHHQCEYHTILHCIIHMINIMPPHLSFTLEKWFYPTSSSEEPQREDTDPAHLVALSPLSSPRNTDQPSPIGSLTPLHTNPFKSLPASYINCVDRVTQCTPLMESVNNPYSTFLTRLLLDCPNINVAAFNRQSLNVLQYAMSLCVASPQPSSQPTSRPVAISSKNPTTPPASPLPRDSQAIHTTAPISTHDNTLDTSKPDEIQSLIDAGCISGPAEMNSTNQNEDDDCPFPLVDPHTICPIPVPTHEENRFNILFETIQLLVTQKTPINLPFTAIETDNHPLVLAISHRNDTLGAYLVYNGSDTHVRYDYNTSVFLAAIDNNMTETACALLEIDPTVLRDKSATEGNTALHHVSMFHNIKLLIKILDILSVHGEAALLMEKPSNTATNPTTPGRTLKTAASMSSLHKPHSTKSQNGPSNGGFMGFIRSVFGSHHSDTPTTPKKDKNHHHHNHSHGRLTRSNSNTTPNKNKHDHHHHHEPPLASMPGSPATPYQGLQQQPSGTSNHAASLSQLSIDLGESKSITVVGVSSPPPLSIAPDLTLSLSGAPTDDSRHILHPPACIPHKLPSSLIDVVNSSKQTPLETALQFSDPSTIPVIHLLLLHGANINRLAPRTHSPLISGPLSKCNGIVLSVLLAYNTFNITHMLNTSVSEHLQPVNINTSSPATGSPWFTALKCCHINVIKYMALYNEPLYNSKDLSHLNPIQFISSGHRSALLDYNILSDFKPINISILDPYALTDKETLKNNGGTNNINDQQQQHHVTNPIATTQSHRVQTLLEQLWAYSTSQNQDTLISNETDDDTATCDDPAWWNFDIPAEYSQPKPYSSTAPQLLDEAPVYDYDIIQSLAISPDDNIQHPNSVPQPHRTISHSATNRNNHIVSPTQSLCRPPKSSLPPFSLLMDALIANRDDIYDSLVIVLLSTWTSIQRSTYEVQNRH